MNLISGQAAAVEGKLDEISASVKDLSDKISGLVDSDCEAETTDEGNLTNIHIISLLN